MAMNIFRALGDLSHGVAKILLLHALFRRQDARGISRKTQELYLLVFLTRYIDLFTTFYSLYNSCMKILYVLTSIWAVFALHFPRGRLRHTCVPQQDTYPHWTRLAVPCAIVALAASVLGNLPRLQYGYSIDLLEILWTYSIVQESVAMVPQMVLMHQYREWGPEVIFYVFFMWLYRTLYIFNWMYRAYNEPMYQHHFLVYACGVLQSGIIVVAWILRRKLEPGIVDADLEGVEYGLLLDDVHEEEGDQEGGDRASLENEPTDENIREVAREMSETGDSLQSPTTENTVEEKGGTSRADPDSSGE